MTNERNPDSALERALAQWGQLDAGDGAAVARIVQHADAIAATSPQHQPALPARYGKDRRWLSFAMGGGAIAASLALALMVMPQPGAPVGKAAGTLMGTTPVMPDAATEQGAYELAAAEREVDSFAMLFTLTAEEEQFL